MRVPFLDDLPNQEVKKFASLLTNVISRREIQKNKPSVIEKVCTFIAAEFFQKRALWPFEKEMKNNAIVIF